MSRKLMTLEVRGKDHRWCFDVYADPQYLAEWQADGVQIFLVENTIPAWMPAWALRPWCVLQDLFNFKNPWSKP